MGSLWWGERRGGEGEASGTSGGGEPGKTELPPAGGPPPRWAWFEGIRVVVWGEERGLTFPSLPGRARHLLRASQVLTCSHHLPPISVVLLCPPLRLQVSLPALSASDHARG